MTSRQIARIALIGFAAAALLVPAGATAQETTAGVKGGLNVANVTFKIPDGSLSVNPDSRSGLIIGGFIARDFNPKAGLVVEVLFSQKGTSFSFSDGVDTFKEEARIHYIEIPILGRYNLKASDDVIVHVFGGPAFAFKAGDSVKDFFNGIEQPSSTGPEDHPKGQDVGVVLGASVDFRQFLIDARYTWGLLNINKVQGSDEPEIRNKTFSVMFGVTLWRKK